MGNFKNIFWIIALAGAATQAPAMTVTVDATSTITKLSEAVAVAYAAEDGADVINIMVNSLAMDDTEIVLDKPITINGNADGDGNKCDILVDVLAIQAKDLVGIDARCYLEIQSPGAVVVNDLKIHPNADLVIGGTGNPLTLVDGIRFNRHLDQTTTPTHVMNRVWVSGSDADNNYVPLDTSADLYGMTGIKRWSRQSGSSAHGVINVSKDSTIGTGNYNLQLNDCHAGLGIGEALNIPAEGGHVTVNGGLYGHSGRNGIRVSGDTVKLTGSPTNRLRIVNVPNINASDSHCIFNATGTFEAVEWVDMAAINTGRNIQVNGAITMPVSNCRLMGKLTATANPIFYMTNNNSNVLVEDTTIVGAGNNYNPFEVLPANDAHSTFTDVIFTSENLGQIMNRNNDTVGGLAFINCAIPTDGELAESLLTTAPIFQDPAVAGTPNYTESNTVTASPDYLLTLQDYDWSEAQGEGKPGNARGNANVYRPSNPAYVGAASDNGDLVGGAGPAPSGIDPSLWMLM